MSAVTWPPCGCPTCRVSRAIRALNDGLDAAIDADEERSMSLAYLRDEVGKAVGGSWLRFAGSRRALKDALAATLHGDPRHHASPQVPN